MLNIDEDKVVKSLKWPSLQTSVKI